MSSDKKGISEKLGEGVLAVLLTADVVLVLLSWLADAAGYSVRSLLSAEGLRWCFLHAGSASVLAPGTLHLLMGLVALGALQYSGLSSGVGRLFSWRHRHGFTTLRQRRALLLSGVVGLAYVAGGTLLLLLPHSPLLSVTGRLFPSPFSQGLPLLLTVGVVCVAAVYGNASNRLRGWAAVVRVSYVGIRFHAVWLLNYLVALQLYAWFDYVFRL